MKCRYTGACFFHFSSVLCVWKFSSYKVGRNRIKELAWKSEVRRWSGPSALDTSQTLWELYLKNWLCICQDSFGWKSQQATSNWERERERERERGTYNRGEGLHTRPSELSPYLFTLLLSMHCSQLFQLQRNFLHATVKGNDDRFHLSQLNNPTCKEDSLFNTIQF